MNRRALSADRLPSRNVGAKLRFLINGGPQVHVANIVALGFLFDRQPGLLLQDEGPNLVNLNVVQVQALELPVHELGAPGAERDHQVHDRRAVNAR